MKNRVKRLVSANSDKKGRSFRTNGALVPF